MGVLCGAIGISKLSELEIDADKDWQTKGITNIKQVAALMSHGDVIARDTNILVRIPAGPDSYVLTSKGVGKLPAWAPAGGALKYYFPVEITLSKSLAIVPIDRMVSKNAPIATQPVKAYNDQPGLNIRLLDKAISLGKTHTVVSVDRTYSRNAAVGRDLSILIEGAVSETFLGVQTDETAAARSGAVNDMNLNPMTPATGDKYYFGFSKKFPRMWTYVSIAGVGNWSNVYEYWNGAWVPVVDEVDESSEFQASGIKRIQWTSQADWAQTTILGMNLYWVRSRTTVFNSQTVKPKGAQVFCCLAT